MLRRTALQSLRCPWRIAAIDDRGPLRRLSLLVASMHMADEIALRCRSRTLGVLLPTGVGTPIATLAGWSVGKAVVPLNYLLKPEELQYVIDDCGTDTVITAKPMLEFLKFTPRVKNLVLMDEMNFSGFPEPRWPSCPKPEDLAFLLYTSGTSGKPKGVMLTHGNIAANIGQVCRWVGFTSKDVMLGVLPQFHSFGLTVLTLLPLAAGIRVVYTARFVPQKIIKLLREHRPTVFVAIPSMYNALLSVKDAAPEDFSSLRYIVSGGEPLPRTVCEQFRRRFGVTICEGYGLTETAPVTNWCRPHEWREGSVGQPLPGVTQRIVDINTGREVPRGEEGEVQIKGPNVMKGYYNLPEQTAAVFTGEGFFRTGDIGRFDGANHLHITGRLKEMLIVGGENVFPREIEEVLERHPSVGAAGVVGVMDPMRGELPAAFVELKEGAVFDEAALKHWCRQHLAGYKVPRDIRLLEKLPRNPTGKLMRRELKGLVANG